MSPTSNGKGDGEEDGDKWEGTCTAGFKCEGDTLQCEVAKAVNDLRCSYAKEAHVEEVARYNADKAGNIDFKPDISANGATQTFTASSIDTTSLFGGGGTGFADYSFSYMGQTLVIPFSQYNPWLLAAGNVLVAIASLIAMYIFARKR
ncbi:hypothetical protein [Ramlibacter sp.]|uniref:hypothetical protein n=1 Tax=Ramlibacter sp. TaxID=1917967 RepID=UPI0017F6D65B|nr:hypothetical protein [Ramlibacter sp.]MBA2675382.1 hypothetical protein [Ramlibacter sp.]